MTSKGFVPMAAAVVLALAALGSVLAAEPSPEAPPTGRRIRQAVERSLPFLEKEGTAWMKQRNCIACHHVPYLLWTHQEAAARGFAVDRNKMKEWNDWSLAFYPAGFPWFKLGEIDLRVLKESVPDAVLDRLRPLVGRGFANREEFLAELGRVLPAEEMQRHQAELVKQASQFIAGGGSFHIAQLILGRKRPAAGDPEAESWAALAKFLVQHQEADGSWKTVRTQFMNQKRPEKEMHEAITLWTVLALNSLEKPDAAWAAANERASSWLKDVRPGQTTESLALLVMTHQRDGRGDPANERLDELLKRQNEDGGWSGSQGQPSNALTTGQSLYALSFTELPGEHPALRRARQFLLKTQTEEGSWVVPAADFSAKSDAEYLKKADAVYTYWGTGWATIGLLRTLIPP